MVLLAEVDVEELKRTVDTQGQEISTLKRRVQSTEREYEVVAQQQQQMETQYQKEEPPAPDLRATKRRTVNQEFLRAWRELEAKESNE